MKSNWLIALVCAFLLAAVVRGEDLKPSTDDAGFKPLFNGKDLTGWDVDNGMIVGETSAENPIKHANTFLIARDGDKDATVADFEFHISWRFAPDRPFGNSGIQYRSHRVIDAKNADNQWIVGGYQADCDLKNGYTGICYEERGRGQFFPLGKKLHVWADGKKEELGDTAPMEDIKTKARKPAGEWNEYVILCKGNHCVQILNGVTTVDFVDEHTGKAAASGILALQLHQGAAMRIEFKDPKIKSLAGEGK
jgi:hypothetical protein